MSNIIFLDVDGPLIPTRQYLTDRHIFDHEFGHYVYDSVAVGMYNKLCKECDAKIVFNSSHNTFGEDKIRYAAVKNGFNEEFLHKDLITKFPSYTIRRSDGVTSWLVDHAKDVKRHVVIDDDKNAATPLVLVEFDVGFSVNNYYEVIKILMPDLDIQRILV